MNVCGKIMNVCMRSCKSIRVYGYLIKSCKGMCGDRVLRTSRLARESYQRGKAHLITKHQLPSSLLLMAF